MSCNDMELLKKSIEDYLIYRLGPSTVLEKATKFPRGTSRLTWFIDYRPEPGAPVRSIIFRGDFAGGSTISTSLEQEYFLYEKLSRTDVPVAKTLWWEDNPDYVDRPFYVREHIEGSWDIPHINDPDPQYDAMRIAISKEHLSKLAIVHNVDWHAVGFDERLSVPPDEAGCAAHFINVLLKQFNGFSEEPVPLLVEAVASLKAKAPIAPRISLCKGTNGLGEEVFKDGIIVAMSDWEEASIGDPAADFASLQNLIPEIERNGEKLWGLEQAVDYYRQVSGINVTVDSVRYYQVLRALGTLIFGQKAATVTHHNNADIRKAWTGTEVYHFAKRALAAAIGLAPPPPPTWLHELNETVK